ncbi:calcium homeostasis modulator protein 6 [Centroberyx gerrardi]|uniref:calcium homeostasis modulator protein 6 n=1 Tax=Centroberyx gerrardi TaxID=166262 RepID=UPI003AAD5BD1
MDKFRTVLNIANKQETNFCFGLLALLTAGGEQIFSSVVFQCPCNSWNFFYGLVFLLVPALALLVLGYILSKKTWKLLTGFCQRKSKLCRWKTLIASVTVFLQISTTAVVAPSSWIAVALLSGNYYECAMTGLNVTAFKEHLCGESVSQSQCQEKLYKFPCGKAVSQADRDDVLATLRAESQILGWLLIASIVVSSLLLTCVARCNSPISYLQLKFWRAYAQEENNLMESYSTKHAKELAERNLKSFFQQTSPDPIVTPSNLDWKKISSLYRFSTKDHYYSTMHQYVENHDYVGGHETDNEMKRMASIKSEGPGANNPTVLAFVDEGQMMP